MSRIGKKPVVIPNGVTVAITGKAINVKGSKGELNYNLPEVISAEVKDNEIIVTRPNDEKATKQLHGTSRALIANMVKGVSEGFKKVLIMKGTGYKSEVKGNKVVLHVGYSTPIEIDIIKGVKVTCGGNGNTEITVEGPDKQSVGQLAAQIREIRKPEPYLGKGIAYSDEHIRRKEGKKAGK